MVASHFQQRVEIFFKVFIIDIPSGKLKYYAIRVEFQVCGNPHIHSFIWVINAPKLSSKSIYNYTARLDGLIKLQNFFTESTIIGQPLSYDLTELEKKKILLKKKERFNVVSWYINEYINSSKDNFYDPLKEHFVEQKYISEISTDLCVSVDTYYLALETFEDTGFQINLRRPANSCFVNNYFQLGKVTWTYNS